MINATKNAPDQSGNSVEGDSQNPYEENQHMNATTTIAPPTDIHNSPVRVAPYTPTILEVDAASAYRDYRVEIRYGEKQRSREDLVDGVAFRWAGQVRIVDDEQLIVLILDQGSRERDLWFLRRVVADIRDGRRSAWPWQEHRGRRTGRTWVSLVPGYGVGQVGALGKGIVPCTTAGCVEHGKHHLVDSLDDEVLHDHVDSVTTDAYRLRLERFGAAPWTLTIEDVYDLDAAALGRLVNDLAWLRGTLGKLNAAEVR